MYDCSYFSGGAHLVEVKKAVDMSARISVLGRITVVTKFLKFCFVSFSVLRDSMTIASVDLGMFKDV